MVRLSILIKQYNLAHAPFLVRNILEKRWPHLWHGKINIIIKSQSTLRSRLAQTRIKGRLNNKIKKKIWFKKKKNRKHNEKRQYFLTKDSRKEWITIDIQKNKVLTKFPRRRRRFMPSRKSSSKKSYLSSSQIWKHFLNPTSLEGLC